MNNYELNIKLKNNFPEILDLFNDEVSWQEGDNTGSHIVYEDVFMPYIKLNIRANNIHILKKCFDFLESILLINDDYANEVISFSVLEPLLFDDEINIKPYLKIFGEKTLLQINELCIDVK